MAENPKSPGAVLDHSVVQIQALQYLFGMVREQLELGQRLLRRGEAHELDLVELMLADQATHVAAVRAGFAPKARVYAVYARGKSDASKISSACRLVTGTSAVGMR